jgi:hypothetical protein
MRATAATCAALGLLVAVAMTGCGRGGAAQSPVRGTDERNGVRVDVRVDLADAGNGALTVTLTPLQSGFHLYGTALPDGGIDGVGRPTRVTVSGGLTGTGPVSADRPVVQLRVPGVSRPMPVYPDGSITLRLPVHRDAGTADHAVAVVGYAACSADTCLPPVSGLRVPVVLP